MFRKSAVALVALFGLVAAKPGNVHQPKPSGPVTPYKKVQQIKMCALYPQYVYPNTGYGAFTFPIYAGACPAGLQVGVTSMEAEAIDAQTYQSLPVTGTRIGVLSGVCSGNPYAGKQFTYSKKSTGGQNNYDNIAGSGTDCQTPGGCSYYPKGPVQFVQDYAFPEIPQGLQADKVQKLANEFCVGNGYSAAVQPLPQENMCYGKLAIKPPATQKNKYPGSQLKYIYNATTVYEFGGATYLVDTQYGLSGSEYQSDELFYLGLWGYSTFSSITCQWVPREIAISPGHVTSGSGKYEKLPQAAVTDVRVVTGRVSPDRNPVAPTGNSYNTYQNTPIQWASEITVFYSKLNLDWTLL